MRVFCLSFHAGYRCQHSGACCRSGWAIPVEPGLRARLEAAAAEGKLDVPRAPFVAGEILQDGSSVLRVVDGACACYDVAGRRCRIHGQLGHNALPVACQHFPRVCLIDRDGIFVTLSHYCPTAAGMLVARLEPCATGELELCATSEVVEAPEGFAPMALEGLDAREELPPLLRPLMLADREGYRTWERLALRVLGEEGAPEQALSIILEATDGVRGWEPGEGPLAEAVGRAFGRARTREAALTRPGAPCFVLSPAALSLDRLVRKSVPAGLDVPRQPPGAEAAHRDLVAPAWPAFAAPVRRYLASKAFANWCAYQGRGFRTVACSIVAALSVLRVEAATQCAAAGRTLDEALLVEAFRSADLLLLHLASREDMARRLSEVEDARTADIREALTGR